MGKRVLMVLMFAGCTGILTAGEYDKELAEVKTGTRIEAKASWWGFNKEDSTHALQAAINSGVKKLIVDNTGSDWIVEPISLVNDQEILFEKGVVVIAKKNSFKNPADSLFTAKCKKNITLRGEDGAVLKMRKADYHDAKLYTQAEWRHTILLLSCENIKIQNLTLLSSGGDGIYVGVQGDATTMNYCKNILIDNVICDDHNRQGISIISAENLTIRNSVFKNTKGTAPEDGIDFEPNEQSESLVNCVVENCSFEGNNGKGIDLFLKTDLPLSISIRNCKVYDNRGIYYSLNGKTVSDKIEVINF